MRPTQLPNQALIPGDGCRALNAGSAGASTPPAEPVATDPDWTRLQPHAHQVTVVRWLPASRRLVRHRHFHRPSDAVKFAQRLFEDGYEVRVFTTATTWVEVDVP